MKHPFIRNIYNVRKLASIVINRFVFKCMCMHASHWGIKQMTNRSLAFVVGFFPRLVFFLVAYAASLLYMVTSKNTRTSKHM